MKSENPVEKRFRPSSEFLLIGHLSLFILIILTALQRAIGICPAALFGVHFTCL